MRVGNGSGREIRANIKGEWYCIEPDKSIEVDDPEVVSILGQYGAQIDRAELQRADAEAADAARAQNSKTASAVASTADIQARQAQVTTDVATGEVVDPNAEVTAARNAEPIPGTAPAGDDPNAVIDGENAGDGEPEKLTGADLDEALTARGLPKTGTADEKRNRVAEYDKAQAELNGDGSTTGDGAPPA